MPDSAVLTSLASILVLLAGVYLVALAVVSVASPHRVRRFLGGFAGSASAHFLELFLRLIVGAALVLGAPRMKFAGLFLVAGWVVLGTTTVMFAVPWRWHQRFARWSVPMATRNMPLFAFGSFAAGVAVLASFLLGPGLE